VLEIINIEKRFHEKSVLRGISFGAPSGKMIGIAGYNGCGKSTLLEILAGILKPDNGEMRMDGVDLLKNRKLRQKIIGYVPQGTPLYEELTAMDNLLMWYSRSEIRESLDQGILGLLGIQDFLHTEVRHMSGGMKKRLSIGCAMTDMPRILLLDEPTAALDLLCRKQILAFLQLFCSRGGSVILVTHELSELRTCDMVYVLANGLLTPCRFDGDEDTLFRMMDSAKGDGQQ
jgi:ABC-2 type transport system ATP-binding protein